MSVWGLLVGCLDLLVDLVREGLTGAGYAHTFRRPDCTGPHLFDEDPS